MELIKSFLQFINEAAEAADSAAGGEEKFCGGLVLYKGGSTTAGSTTPTGQANTFSNNMFGLTADDICNFAKAKGLPTTDNKTFQTALYKWLIANGRTLVISKMWETYGNTEQGKTKSPMTIEAFADGMLGARTFFVIKELVRVPDPVPVKQVKKCPMYGDRNELIMAFRRSINASEQDIDQQDVIIQKVNGSFVPMNVTTETPGVFTGERWTIPWYIWNNEHDATTHITDAELQRWSIYKTTFTPPAGTPPVQTDMFGKPVKNGFPLRRDSAVDNFQQFSWQ